MAAAPFLGLAVALGAGLLIGLERERRKGEGNDRAAAGIRSFTVAALCGALAHWLDQSHTALPGLVLMGALLIIALTATAYVKSQSRDPGLTTELALFATYLLGVLAIDSPPLAAACAAVLALLLATRQRLHALATHWLSEQELHNGLLLAALALVVLPLIPAQPQAWLGDIRLRPLAAMVLLLLAMQSVGQMALRGLGPRAGIAASGFFGGFISSTATIATLGQQARGHPTEAPSCAAGAALSCVATWLQMAALVTALSPLGARTMAPALGAGLLASLLGCAVLWRQAKPRHALATPAVFDTPGTPAEPFAERAASDPAPALALRTAVLIALMLTAVTAAVSWAEQHFGTRGVLVSAALAGLADAHAPTSSLSALFASGQIAGRELVLGVLLAVSCNSGTRLLTALLTGGRTYAARVGAVLLLGNAGAWGLAWGVV